MAKTTEQIVKERENITKEARKKIANEIRKVATMLIEMADKMEKVPFSLQQSSDLVALSQRLITLQREHKETLSL